MIRWIHGLQNWWRTHKTSRHIVSLAVLVGGLLLSLSGCGGVAGGFSTMASTYLVLAWVVGLTLFMAGCGNDVNGNAGVAGPTVTATATATATATVTPTPAIPTPAKLAFQVQPGQVDHSVQTVSTVASTPSAAVAATALPAFVVLVEDSNGNIVTTASNAITVAFGANPNQATLSGTLTVNAVKGVAIFSNVIISNAGSGYTLVVSSPGLTGATSNSLTVGPLPTNFTSNIVIPLPGIIPADVVVADFNGDGIPDIAVNQFEFSPSGVFVLLGNGDGTFGAPQNFATRGPGIGIAAADLNHDGHTDLIVCDSYSSDKVVSVLLGNGDGTFQTASNLSVSRESVRVAVADFNGDGHLDIVTTDGSSKVSVLLGNGDGTFQPAVNYSAAKPFSVVAADVNGDGHLDLVTSSETTGGGISVLLGNGDGTFQAPANISLGVPMLGGLAVADFNGDGKLDIAQTVYYGGSILIGEVSVYLGNGDGTFKAPVNYSTGTINSLTLVAADLNLDLSPDLINAPLIGSGANVLFSNGDGTFQPGQTLGGGGLEHVGVAVADLNGDLKPDVVSSSIDEKYPNYNGSVRILLHQ